MDDQKIELETHLPEPIEPENLEPKIRKGSSFKWFLMISLLCSLGVGAFFYFHQPHHYSFPLRTVEDTTLATVKIFDFKEPIQQFWKEHVFNDRSSYQVENDTLHAASNGNSSMIYQEVKLGPVDRPFLTWDWKAVRFPANKTGKSLADKSNNDFTGRVYAIFKGRSPIAADVIQYVWDDHFPKGTSSGSPFLNSVRILVIESGTAPDWVSEKRDLLQDYQTLFGRRPRWPLSAVGIMTDSDNTKTQSEIYYRNFALKKPQPAAEPSKEPENI